MYKILDMKRYIYAAVAIGLLILFTSLFKMCSDVQKYKSLYNRELNNVEAYANMHSSMQDEIREFKLTVDELRSSRDSINAKLLKTIDSLKIKDKNIQYLQYNTSIIQKVDTILLQDTIFRKPVNIDTIVGDYWYSMNLKLQYPSTIVTAPTFKSEKQVIISTKKEYNKKPSKIFFIRWFQKKHNVVTVDVIESNPYIENKENRFIKVVKE